MSNLIVAVLLLIACASQAQAQARVAVTCVKYKAEITGSARQVFGWGAPVATLGAQVQQESACNPMAKSHVGAGGLTQFMPATAKDMGARFTECAPVNPFSASWAIKCRDRYMLQLLRANSSAASECDQWAFALVAYNGGQGWLNRDKRRAKAAGSKDNAWWQNVELHSNRAAWAFKENRGYPRRIIQYLSPAYTKAGWGRSVCD